MIWSFEVVIDGGYSNRRFMIWFGMYFVFLDILSGGILINVCNVDLDVRVN